MGATDSTQEFSTALRTRLLTYTDGGAAPASIGAAVGERLWHNRPPGSVGPTSYPYVLLTVTLLPPQDDMDWHRRGVMVEVMVVDRPHAKLARAQRLADLAAKALSQWDLASAADGSVKFRPPTIDPIPSGGDDTDKEVVQIRVMADSGYAWWKAA